MSNSDIVGKESARLKHLGIEYEHIQSADGMPVVTVNTSVMSRIVSSRDSGDLIKGRFVCQTGTGHWSASFIDSNGEHSFRDDLSECLAYRFVLGYRIGRMRQLSRYKGQAPPLRHRRYTEEY